MQHHIVVLMIRSGRHEIQIRDYIFIDPYEMRLFRLRIQERSISEFLVSFFFFFYLMLEKLYCWSAGDGTQNMETKSHAFCMPHCVFGTRTCQRGPTETVRDEHHFTAFSIYIQPNTGFPRFRGHIFFNHFIA